MQVFSKIDILSTIAGVLTIILTLQIAFPRYFYALIHLFTEK